MEQKYILSIDQGTSGTKAVVFDLNGRLVVKGSAALKSTFPQPGFVEQDAEEIYQNVLTAVKHCFSAFREKVGPDLSQIAACGISNQRETWVLWDKSGVPLYNAVVWQCKRSVDICNRLKAMDLEPEIRVRTGLIIDPYFSGTKALWMYENLPAVQKAVDDGRAMGGTVDSWLLYRLSGGTRFCTDFTNACRTLLFNITDMAWDSFLLQQFKMQGLQLPRPCPSAFDYGETDFDGLLEKKIKICGMIGDSHAAAFGEGCFDPGDAKVTLGTGSSILWNTGDKQVMSKNGMMTTICWSLPGRTDYALEGIIVTAGATVKWLQDQLGLIAGPEETERMAAAVTGNNGVYLVPAFSGLGAPHWKMAARALICGLTFGTGKNHLVRAALESIPYQIKDVFTAMQNDAGIAPRGIKADGGMSANGFVMQFIADILGTTVTNIGMQDVSALGAAYMAGLGCGLFRDPEHLKELQSGARVYDPGPQQEKVGEWYEGWKQAVGMV